MGQRRLQTKKTVLIYTEGFHDYIFTKYLHQRYANSQVRVTVKPGTGGCPKNIVIGCSKFQGAFQKRVVILDNDKSEKEMLEGRMFASKKNIILIENTPNLEATLLSIMENGADFSKKASSWCKKQFEKTYICYEKRNDLNEYEKLFTMDILEKRSPQIKILASLKNLIQGT